MHRALYLTATGPRTGKRAIALGTMSILSRNMQDVAIFRPIINEPQLDDRALSSGRSADQMSQGGRDKDQRCGF